MPEVVPVTLTETVQARGETVTRERITVQETGKLGVVYILPGTTQMQKLQALRSLVASQRMWDQLPLLAYIADIQAAPTSLETVEVDFLD